MVLGKKLGAEFIGTFLLVLGGCGSAIFAAKALNGAKGNVGVGGLDIGVAGVVDSGIGYLGVSLAFGLTVVCGAYALGHVSGGHFNPAVSVGLATAKRFEWKDVPAYVIVQCVGGHRRGGGAVGHPGRPAGRVRDHPGRLRLQRLRPGERAVLLRPAGRLHRRGGADGVVPDRDPGCDDQGRLQGPGVRWASA